MPSGPPVQVSTLQASSHSGSLALPSTAPDTDPVGPGWKQRTGSLSPRCVDTENSGSQTLAPSSWETPIWPLLWKSWRRLSPHTWSDLQGEFKCISGCGIQICKNANHGGKTLDFRRIEIDYYETLCRNSWSPKDEAWWFLQSPDFPSKLKCVHNKVLENWCAC